jgi:voltage-gated potassium channel
MNTPLPQTPGRPDPRLRMTTVIFGTDTPAGRNFDVALIVCIVLSVAVVAVDSVAGVHARYGRILDVVEWAFTILFTLEYIARLWSAPSTARYAVSFFGIVDLVAVLPSFASLVLPGAQVLIIVRSLRLLRVFRVVKLFKYLRAADLLVAALRSSRQKIAVFLFAVLVLVTVFGTVMYVIEGGSNGFTSIPRCVYWAIVTLTTVGYGDISPQTTLGQAIAAVIMILGYGIIAVPTGLVSVELARAGDAADSRECPDCGARTRGSEALFCSGCGKRLGDEPGMKG